MTKEVTQTFFHVSTANQQLTLRMPVQAPSLFLLQYLELEMMIFDDFFPQLWSSNH